MAAADELTLLRIKSLLRVLESAVTAALPLITAASDIHDRMKRLHEISDNPDNVSMVEEFFREYRAIGDVTPEIGASNAAFRNALEILDLDLATDYGMSVSVAATMIATFVVKNASLTGRLPEEVWQEYVLRESDMNGFI